MLVIVTIVVALPLLKLQLDTGVTGLPTLYPMFGGGKYVSTLFGFVALTFNLICKDFP